MQNSECGMRNKDLTIADCEFRSTSPLLWFAFSVIPPVLDTGENRNPGPKEKAGFLLEFIPTNIGAVIMGLCAKLI